MTIAGNRPARPRIEDLARHGDAPAVIHGGRTLSHRELDDLVEARTELLGSTRRLVMLECANDLEPLVTYLAALRGGHPVLLMPAQASAPARRHAERVVRAYRPDVVLRRTGPNWALEESWPGTVHDLHPDLAVLLGTSGSTGTPKLVRLSHENLRSNAEAIAGYLGLGPDSRAATTLPMQYCYGLSVINSHLFAGGSVWLTGSSVVDPGFWSEFTAAGATSFAGVPYTFDLLEQSGADWTRTHGLRHVTQAGGRMPVDRVRRVATATLDAGVDFFVMYGQTEATARMAYLPPRLAFDRPDCIGIPIEGGEFRIDDGELVYSGPNVMMGYAEAPADLARAGELSELRTGDLAVQHDDGLYEIVGRRNRMAKLFGTRLDLDLAERLLADRGIAARLVAADERLRVFVDVPADSGRAVDLVRADHCLPAHAVLVQQVESFPTTSTGKPDYAALSRLPVPCTAEPAPDVRSAYAGVFGRTIADADSFLSLGGDSLSYVESYVRLERLLGKVPADWPQLTVGQLSALTPQPRRRWVSLETPLFLRASAILLIVGSHVGLWTVLGGAHTLLAIFGFNLARFALAQPTIGSRVRAVGRSLAAMMVPAALWITGVILITGEYGWQAPFGLTNWLGSNRWNDDWAFWFLESAVWTTVAVTVLLAVPAVSRAYRRKPFAVATAVLLAAMLVRELTSDTSGNLGIYTIEATAWCLVIGWVIAVATTTRTRMIASVLIVACMHDFFTDQTSREILVMVLLLALTWVPTIRVPRPLDRMLAVIASASLFVYVTHWQIYPPLEDAGHSFLALVASIGLGVAVWAGYVAIRSRATRWLRSPVRTVVPAVLRVRRRSTSRGTAGLPARPRAASPGNASREPGTPPAAPSAPVPHRRNGADRGRMRGGWRTPSWDTAPHRVSSAGRGSLPADAPASPTPS